MVFLKALRPLQAIVFFLIIEAPFIRAQDNLLQSFHPINLLNNTVNSYQRLPSLCDPRQHTEGFKVLVMSTLGLYVADEDIFTGTRLYSRKIGLLPKGSSGREQKFIGKQLGDFAIGVPGSLNSFFWHFGDVITVIITMGGFTTYGIMYQNIYAVETAAMLLQGLVITGSLVFPIKVLTARESPSRASRLRGKWHLYPGLTHYLKDQSRYYAYPSGHTATFTTLLTIVAQRYSQYRRIIKPVGYTMLGLLMIALINNDAHWASDFPLGFAIGLNVGLAVSQTSASQEPVLLLHHWHPIIDRHRLGISYLVEF